MLPDSQSLPYPTPRRLGVQALVVGLVTLWGAACDSRPDGSSSGDTISPERFIEAIVELREAGLRSPTGSILPAERDAILSRLEVDEGALRTFVDVHGTNVPLMTDVWTEVERQIADRLGVPPLPEPEFLEGDSVLPDPPGD